MAIRWTVWSSSSIGTTGSLPQASRVALSDGIALGKPENGSTEIWSMTERRTMVRWPASSSAEPSQFMGPKMRSDIAFQLTWLPATGRSTVAVAPGAMSLRRTADEPTTMAAASRVSAERLVTVPWSRPSTSRRSATTSGPVALASARIVRMEPNPTARSRTRDGSPWRTSSAVVVPVPKMSPFMGADSSASPGTRTW